MDNKELLTGDRDNPDVSLENEHPLPLYEAPLTALEFEIADSEPVLDDQPILESEVPAVVQAAEVVSVSVEEETESIAQTVKERDPHGEEFLIPESYTDDFDTPANIRPTYLPKFTEVSDTYRMQNDPRPRIDTGKPTTLA